MMVDTDADLDIDTHDVAGQEDEMRLRIRSLTVALSVALLGAALASLAVAPMLSMFSAAVLVGWCQLPSV